MSDNTQLDDVATKIIKGEFYVLAEVTEDADGVGFSFYMLGVDDDPVDYIVVMTDMAEVEQLRAHVDVPKEFTVEQMDAGFLLDLIDDEMSYLINPVTDGFVFEGKNFRALLAGIVTDDSEDEE